MTSHERIDYIDYMRAGFTPVIICNMTAATDWVQTRYPIFEITFHDDQFFADGIATDYYWEKDTLFRRKK